MNKFFGIGAIILVGVIASFFTVSNRSVLKFNDATIDKVSAVDGNFLPILKIMGEYSDNKAIDADKFSKVITESESGIKSVVTQIETAAVPDSDLCKNFHGSVLAYTKNSLAIVLVYKDKVLPYVKLHNPPTEKDASVVEGLLANSIAEDTRLLEAVKASQVSMAKKYKIKLQ
jgi:hypothetical protein